MEAWHLVDAAYAQACSTTLALLAQSRGRMPGVNERVILLGGRSLRRDAESAGVRVDHQIGVPSGHGVLGWPAVWRRVRDLPPPDLLHCWSPGAALTAALFPWRVPRLLTLTMPLSPRAQRVLVAMSRVSPHPWTVLSCNATLRHDLICRGIDPQRVHVLRPAVDMGLLDPGRRDALRAAWGVVEPDTIVVATVADPTTSADAELAMMVAALADFSRQIERTTIRVLVDPASRHRRRAVGHTRAVGHGERVITDAALATPWRVLPGCDAVLAVGESAGGLSLLWSMAAGVPIVADATSSIGEILEDHHSALLAPPRDTKRLAHRLRQVIDDSQLAWKLRDTARHEAFSLFGRQHYCQSLAIVYAQCVAGEPIDVPAPPVTGGMRFMGRA